jgi:inorganic pyrophosphatase
LGEDGDAVDVLLLMEEPAFVGCLVPARLIGVIVAEQDGKERNDRLVAVIDEAQIFEQLNSLCDMPPQHLKEIQEFFTSYHRTEGKEFKVLDVKGPKAAKKIVANGEELHKKQKKSQ